MQASDSYYGYAHSPWLRSIPRSDGGAYASAQNLVRAIQTKIKRQGLEGKHGVDPQKQWQPGRAKKWDEWGV